MRSVHISVSSTQNYLAERQESEDTHIQQNGL